MARRKTRAADPDLPVDGRNPADPGEIWEGLVVLPSVLIVAIVSSIIRFVVDGSSNPLLAGFAGIVGGTATWIALRVFFYRPGFRFGDRYGHGLKDLLMLGGPPFVALMAALFAE